MAHARGCPTCGRDGARVYIASQTVLTVRCAHCTHVWCVDMKLLPDSVSVNRLERTCLMATDSRTSTRIALGAVLDAVVNFAQRLFRRKRKPRSIELGTVSQTWLAAERGLREDRF